MLNRTKGIIFDVDGTLWDVSDLVAESWNIALGHQPGVLRRVTAEEIRGMMGKTMTEIYNLILPGRDKQFQELVCRECEGAGDRLLRERGANLYPAEEKTLEMLFDTYRLFIVSNCRDGYIEQFLGFSNFGRFFEDSECFGRTGKPKCDNIRLLLERNHLEKAVYVGDTHLDFESARGAGVPFIHAAYGYGKVPEAKYAVQSFSGLSEVMPQVL